MKVSISIDTDDYRHILEYLHYQLPENLCRRFSDFTISPSFMINEHSFEYQDMKFTIDTKDVYQKMHHFRKYSEIIIEGKQQDIQEFITLAVSSMKKNRFQKEFCVVYRSQYNNWSEQCKLEKRSLSTVYLPSKIKQDLIDDLKKFYNEDYLEVYSKLNIIHNRMYMLHGLPGTGKTTLIKALATEFNKNIAYIYIKSDMEYDNFNNLITNLPNNTFIVFEDVDSLFSENRKQTTGLTFSGFINVFDGISTAKNLIVFFTTNNIDIIDKAIIRRISYFIEFDYATKEQIKDMFDTFFPNHSFDEFYKNINCKTTINIMEKFFTRYLLDDIVEKSKLFGKFANGDLSIKTPDKSLYL
jgi:predicted AAA+ superfamily ATPase